MGFDEILLFGELEEEESFGVSQKKLRFNHMWSMMSNQGNTFLP